MPTLSSRDRMLAVLNYQQPDYVPLVFNAFGFQPPPGIRWGDHFEQAEGWLSLGVDAWLHIHPPQSFDPAVTVREWEETPPGERYPVMVKEYVTPGGVLRQEVYRTEDWVTPEWPGHKDGAPHIELFDDYNVARYRRALVNSEADVAALKYLLCLPSGDELARFRENAAHVARRARELGVLVVGSGPGGVDIAVWLCGVRNLLDMALDRPALFAELMDAIQEWDERRMALLLDTPVDLVIRRGYYEGTSFWSPAIFRRYFAPGLRKLATMVHQAGRRMAYTMSVGYLPLLDDLAGLGHDAHYLLDPLPEGRRADLLRVKAAYEGRVAVIGGLNEPITLEFGTRDEIRKEVFSSVEMLGKGGGLCLSPAEAIMASTPWSSLLTLIEAWKECREYA